MFYNIGPDRGGRTNFEKEIWLSLLRFETFIGVLPFCESLLKNSHDLTIDNK